MEEKKIEPGCTEHRKKLHNKNYPNGCQNRRLTVDESLNALASHFYKKQTIRFFRCLFFF